MTLQNIFNCNGKKLQSLRESEKPLYAAVRVLVISEGRATFARTSSQAPGTGATVVFVVVVLGF